MANHIGIFIHGREFEPQSGHITFAEIDHEIISKVIFSLPLIQERQWSVASKSIITKYWLTA